MVNSSEFCPSMKLKALKAIEHIKSLLVLAMIALALTVIPLSPPVSAQPLNSWSSTTSYPTGIASQSCATSSGFIYCVGGTTFPAVITDAVYFAPITSSGVGTWNPTTSYPFSIFEQSCVARASFVYCVGGQANPSGFGPGPTIAVFFAPISSSGVGTWTTTTSYPLPISEQSCVTRAALTYCVGGNPPFSTSAVFVG